MKRLLLALALVSAVSLGAVSNASAQVGIYIGGGNPYGYGGYGGGGYAPRVYSGYNGYGGGYYGAGHGHHHHHHHGHHGRRW